MTTHNTTALPNKTTLRICKCAALVAGVNACPHCGRGWAEVSAPMALYVRVGGDVIPVEKVRAALIDYCGKKQSTLRTPKETADAIIAAASSPLPAEEHWQQQARKALWNWTGLDSLSIPQLDELVGRIAAALHTRVLPEQLCTCTDHDPEVCLNGEVDEGSRYCHCKCHAPAEPEGEREK